MGAITSSPTPGGTESPTPAGGVQGLTTTTPSGGVGGLSTPNTGAGGVPLGIAGGLMAAGLAMLGIARRMKTRAGK